MKLCVILCTVPDRQTADTVAKSLVSKKLAACVKIVPDVTSVYRWDGEVVTDRECQLIIKTTESNVKNAFSLVSIIHPYDVPEWVVLNDTEASEDYGNWVNAQTVDEK